MAIPLAAVMVIAGLACALAAARLADIAGFPVPDLTKRYGLLDGLRGYLALAVMAAHTAIWEHVLFRGESWETARIPVMLSNCGVGAVSMFFMITGYIFYPRIRGGVSGGRAWGAFFLTRLLRLYPAAVLSIALVVAIILIRLRSHPPVVTPHILVDLAHWLSFKGERPLFGFQDSWLVNGGVTWSLWYELIFYFLVTPVLSAVRALTRTRVPMVAIVAALWIGCLMANLAGRNTYYMVFFFTGMIAFELVERPGVRNVLRSGTASILGSVALLGAVLIPPNAQVPPQLVLYGFFLTCVASGNDFWGLLRHRVSLILGEASYSIYLFHAIMLYALMELLRPALPGLTPAATTELAIPAAFVVVSLSCAVFVFVEKPGITLGRNLAKRLAHQRTAQHDAARLMTAP